VIHLSECGFIGLDGFLYKNPSNSINPHSDKCILLPANCSNHSAMPFCFLQIAATILQCLSAMPFCFLQIAATILQCLFASCKLQQHFYAFCHSEGIFCVAGFRRNDKKNLLFHRNRCFSFGALPLFKD
jgi:hypothetical protein